MLLSEFCSLVSSQREWVGVSSGGYGVREAREQNAPYVPPEMAVVQDCHPLTPAIFLITAAAAVGKSAAASYLSTSLKSPILDLSSLQVGDATLEGALSKALGRTKFAEYMDKMEAGRATLIVDALDEAEVRSGQTNFTAFIRGLAETASSFSGRPGIILMSRAESARSLTSLFEERRIPFAHYEILSFSRQQAEQYLDLRISGVYAQAGRDAVHHRHVEPFCAARDRLFATLASALSKPADDDLWSVPEIRDFLGYAPVLDVAAEYLAVDNFASLGSSFHPRGEDRRLVQWDLVAEVIDHLLIREQEKFVNQFVNTPEFLSLKDPRLASALFTPEEQCARLLDYVENVQFPMGLPAHLPERIREPYETAVGVQLSNHPFVRNSEWFNVIFRDYVTARAIISPTTPGAASAAVRKNLLAATWKHSPMFAFFSYSLSCPLGSTVAHCHSEVIGALYESFKSMCDTRDRLYLNLGRSGDRLLAIYGVLADRSGQEPEESPFIVGPLSFLSLQGNASVIFPRELSYAQIYEVPEIIIGGDGGSFKLGPNVFLSCGDLLVAATDIQVFGAPDDDLPVMMDIRSLTAENNKIRIVSGGLKVVCDEAPYPWSQHRLSFTSLASYAADSRESYQLYLELRRIVLRFKDAKRGQVALYQPFLDNLVIGENRRARTALDFLRETGCVTLRNSVYLLDLAEFAKLGISRTQLRDLQDNKASIEVRRRLLEFAARNES